MEKVAFYPEQGTKLIPEYAFVFRLEAG
jgi:hypothetical protein